MSTTTNSLTPIETTVAMETATEKTFHTWDYVVFGLMLMFSALIGVYFAIKDRNNKSTENYLLGNRTMSGWPVALSLTASFMSAITVLGTPAEFYLYGSMFWWFALSYTTMVVITAHVFVPVFYRMGISSTYEYLQIRFDRSVRLCGTAVFTFQTVLYMGMVMYMPALALNKVTGLSLYLSICLTAGVCTFYTAIGGLKAVIWTDVLQCVVMWGGFAAIIIKGSSLVGGISQVFQIAADGGRLDFGNWSFDPRVRHSFWAVWVGGTFMWLAVYAVNQSMVQRYLSCKSLFQAKLSLYLNDIGLFVVVSLAAMSGLTMYSVYHNCDPLTMGYVEKSDQLTPFFVMDILSSMPGIPGLFVASAYSGTLSTVSTGINALACTTLEDFVKICYPHMREKREIVLSKLLVVFYGIMGLGVAFLASLMDKVLTLALKMFGIIGGPLLGLFALGLFTSFANAKGSITGLFSGLGIGFWLAIGSYIFPPTLEFTNQLELSTAGCESLPNATTTAVVNVTTGFNTTVVSDRPHIADTFYALSYCHYAPFLAMCTFGIGAVASLVTGGLTSRYEVDPASLAFPSCFSSNGMKKIEKEKCERGQEEKLL